MKENKRTEKTNRDTPNCLLPCQPRTAQGLTDTHHILRRRQWVGRLDLVTPFSTNHLLVTVTAAQDWRQVGHRNTITHLNCLSTCTDQY